MKLGEASSHSSGEDTKDTKVQRPTLESPTCLLLEASQAGNLQALDACTIVVFVAAVEIMTMIKTKCLQSKRSAESISVLSGAGHRPPGDPSC